MTDPRQPVRLASVHFDAPTHEPLVVAVLVTRDPETGAYRAYTRSGAAYLPPDPDLIALLAQSCEITNLPEREQT